MQLEELQKTLTSLLERVQADSQLEEDEKTDLIDLINSVVADPTPNNFDALAIVIDELGKSQEYMAAKEIIQNYNQQN